MFDSRQLCITQQKKISFYILLIIFSIISFVAINITIVTTNIAMQNRIIEKKSSIGAKRSEATKVKKTLKFVEDYKIDDNLKRKNGFYSSIDKQDFISSVITKMNNEDDLDFIDEMRKNKINLEYSGFLIRLNSSSNKILEKIFTKIKNQIIISNEQKVDVAFDTSTVRVNFNADYEYVAYRVLEMIKQIFPGYLIIKNFSVTPVNDDMRKILYNRKFGKKNIDYKLKLDDRLSCVIEFEWLFLKSNNKK